MTIKMKTQDKHFTLFSKSGNSYILIINLGIFVTSLIAFSSAFPAETVGDSSSSSIRAETCDATVCEKHICRVEESMYTTHFYARCPTPLLHFNPTNYQKYCMCASAYHRLATAAKEAKDDEPVVDDNVHLYQDIVPGPNCKVPESEGEKDACKQEPCKSHASIHKGVHKVHICTHEQKHYCACFNTAD